MSSEQLEEGKISNTVAAATIAGSALLGFIHGSSENSMLRTHPTHVVATKHVSELASRIKGKYKHLSDNDAVKYASLAKKHEHPVFPKAEDILAISGIESSFNPNAKSKLKVAPARGLMQVRPEIWGIKKKDLETPEQQIKKGAEILTQYHSKFGDIDSAVHAYNIGETNLRKGKNENPKYVSKYKEERKLYD
jgi:membrane-bound lytic murein transglycosylase MltF